MYHSVHKPAPDGRGVAPPSERRAGLGMREPGVPTAEDGKRPVRLAAAWLGVDCGGDVCLGGVSVGGAGGECGSAGSSHVALGSHPSCMRDASITT